MMTDDNLFAERDTFVTHLVCGLEGDSYPADQVHGLSQAGGRCWCGMTWRLSAKAITKEDLARRPAGMWRYRELLPVRQAASIVSLGECETPLVRLPKLEVGRGQLIVKDESRLPTGSFKARGLCMAVSMARELGISRIAMPTNGNAGAALAAYASRAGIEAFIFCPDDTPEINMREIAAPGSQGGRVNGLINDCGRIVGEGKEPFGWFDLSTLKEPYRIEGKKTMGLELADSSAGRCPM